MTTIFRKLKLVTIFFCVFTTLSLNLISSSAVPKIIPYGDHCASFVPESTLKADGIYHPHEYLHTGYYYTGEDTVSGSLSWNFSYDHQLQNSVKFHVWSFEETAVQGLFKLRANLRFPKARTYYYEGNFTSSRRSRSRSIHADPIFRLQGFWSESSRRLCMVGYGRYKNLGASLNQPAVLKLYNLTNSTTITSLVSGTIESLIPSSDIVKDPRYFDPVSILMLPLMNYQYTNSTDDTSFGETDDHDPSSSLKLERFCSQLSPVVSYINFDLQYSSKCVSAKDCTPLAVLDHLPGLMSLKSIDCWESERKLRVLVEFADSSNRWFRRPFNPNTTLVAEGSWNAKNNQLQFVACHLLQDATNSFNNSHVGDCSTRLSFRFPATWTIGNTSSVLGHVWSNKSKTESGYFQEITFNTQQSEAGRALLPGNKYEYTRLDQVNKLCPRKKSPANGHSSILYPSPGSYDMRFSMSARSSKGLDAWGYSDPVSVGDKLYEELTYSTQYTNSAAIDEDGADTLVVPLMSVGTISSYNHSIPTNISYRISIQLLERSVQKSSNDTIRRATEMQIFAEGIYDTEGSLCMVGCRNVGFNSTHQTTEDSVDCDILVNFQFPPENRHSNNKGYIKVSIKSTRKKSDPLYFERLDLSSVASYMNEAERCIWRMDMEIILVLVSTTLACVFVALQQFHVKKHPDVLPSISILMLLTLTLGYMIPLMLNFDAMFTHNTNRQDIILGSGGWLAVNEAIVRVITMVAFLLQFRLLQQTWSARSSNGKQKELWDVEKKALPLYLVGFFVASMDLKSYAGLVLDGFLFPQILLNMACKSKEKVLSVPFYIGTTLVRVLPHAYDLYRTHSSVHQQPEESYIYASPVADFYSTSWDIIIPIGGLLLSLIIFLQQKFGGRCFLPQKLRGQGSYEEVPSISEDELPR